MISFIFLKKIFPLVVLFLFFSFAHTDSYAQYNKKNKFSLSSQQKEVFQVLETHKLLQIPEKDQSLFRDYLAFALFGDIFIPSGKYFFYPLDSCKGIIVKFSGTAVSLCNTERTDPLLPKILFESLYPIKDYECVLEISYIPPPRRKHGKSFFLLCSVVERKTREVARKTIVFEVPPTGQVLFDPFGELLVSSSLYTRLRDNNISLYFKQ